MWPPRTSRCYEPEMIEASRHAHQMMDWAMFLLLVAAAGLTTFLLHHNGSSAWLGLILGSATASLAALRGLTILIIQTGRPNVESIAYLTIVVQVVVRIVRCAT